MVNVSSKSEARKRIRDAQNKANEERAARERQNADDTATLVVALGRLKAVDEWQEKRETEIHAEADRRRHQHRETAATALARMQGRGETLGAIATLANVSTRELNALKSAPTSSPQQEAPSGKAVAADRESAAVAITDDAIRVDALTAAAFGHTSDESV